MDAYGFPPQNSRKAALELILHFFLLPLDIFHIPDFIQNVDFQRDWKRAVLAVVICCLCGPFVYCLMIFLAFLGLYLAIVQLIEPFILKHNCLKRSMRQVFEELSVLMFEDDVVDDLSHGFVEIPSHTNIHIPGPSLSTDQFTTFQHDNHLNSNSDVESLDKSVPMLEGPDGGPFHERDEIREPIREESISRTATDQEVSLDDTDMQPTLQEPQKQLDNQITTSPRKEVANRFLNSSTNHNKTRRGSQELVSREDIVNLEESKVVTTNRKKILANMEGAMRTSPTERKTYDYDDVTTTGNVRAKASLFQG